MFKTTWAVLICVWTLLSAIYAEDTKMDILKEREKLLALDLEIAQLSAKSGVLKALHPHMTNETILFPKSGWPLEGANSCAEVMNSLKTDKYESRIEWVPLFSMISRDGTLGYTHGRFEMPYDDGEEHEAGIPHYYATIWKRLINVQWKVAASVGLLFLEKNSGKRPPNHINLQLSGEDYRQVVHTELAFADTALKKGIPQAFHEFIDEDGITLGQSGEPRTKRSYAEAIKKAAADGSQNPKALLEWEPFYCYVSSSGDLAYDWGPAVYTLTPADAQCKKFHGYFLTIWKKTPSASWRFVLDAGNECPPPPGEKLEQ